MAADQKVSPQRAGMKSRPPMRSPKESCNGSNMVTYPCSLILFAKNIPPGACIGKERIDYQSRSQRQGDRMTWENFDADGT